MPRLADRSRLPPGGLRFYDSVANWAPTAHLSFDATVAEIVAHREKHRHLTELHGWSTDPKIVADELDSYNSKVCAEMGWTQYITEGGPDTSIPFTLTRQKRAVQLATGAKPLLKWSINGEVVDEALAAKRAEVCAACPMNVKKQLIDYFTDAAASLIQKELEIRNGRKLSTPHDSDIGICDACGCPLHLKVHCPIEFIKNEVAPQKLSDFDPRCWITSEIAAS